jgi:hypothetical protein
MACIMKMMAHNLQNNIDKLHFSISTMVVNVINKDQLRFSRFLNFPYTKLVANLKILIIIKPFASTSF